MATKTKLIKGKIYTQEEMDEITYSEYLDELLRGGWTQKELDEARHFREFELVLHNLKVQEEAASSK